MWPRRFVELATHQSIASEFERNAQLLSAYPSRQLPPERVKALESQESERTRKIRAAYGKACLQTFASIVLGLVTGRLGTALLGPLPQWIESLLAVLSAAIVLTATLGLLGWEIQSWKGTTLPEQVNRALFRALYWLGTFLFAVSVSGSTLGIR